MRSSERRFYQKVTDIYLEYESRVIDPLVTEGDAFVPSDEKAADGVWLNESFAKAWDVAVGDDFTIEYGGMNFTRKVRGLILTPEYEYTKAEEDADTNFKNLAYVYMSFDAFLVGEYADQMTTYTTMLIRLTEDALSHPSSTADNVSAAMSYEKKIAEAMHDHYSVMIDAKSIIGMQRVQDELSQHDTFSYAFALIFLVIAVFIIATTMSRLVERQRTQIGTMNALGIKRGVITLHYIGYSFFVSVFGVLLGELFGPLVIGQAIVDMLMSWYMVPDVAAGANGMFAVVGIVVVACCVLASFLSCRKLLLVAPAEALRPAAPRKAKRLLAERFAFWNRLRFRTQYNLRDLSRAPMRAAMGIIGTAVGMVLTIFSFGCKVLVDDIVVWDFEKIQNFSYELILSGDKDIAYYDDLAAETDGELVMTDEIELAKQAHAPASEKSKQSITVIEGKGLYNVTDEKTEVMELTPGTISVTSRLAKSMGIHVGDTVFWHIYSKNKWYESKVGSINRSPETAGITILRRDLEKLGCAYTPVMIATDQKVTGYDKRDGISAVYDMAQLQEAFEEGYEVINVLFYMMMAFSVITVIVVLYNSGNLSFHERRKEFATLKVMGFANDRIRGILNQENIWLSVIGVFVGVPFAKPALLAMMNSNGENFDYYVEIPPALYLAGGVFVLAVAVLVSFLFSRKIRTLDMVETFKGME